MVSKAREDFPEPDRPVITTSLSRGMETSIFFKLLARAPLTMILSCIMCMIDSFQERFLFSVPEMPPAEV